MTGTRIGITGADGEHRVQANRRSSRTLRFPDGAVRHFTLRNWQWEVADWLHRDAGWSEGALPRIAYETAMTFWFQDIFNDAARPRSADRTGQFSENAADVTRRRTHSGERARFEQELREAVEGVIRVNMKRCAGQERSVSNDPFD